MTCDCVQSELWTGIQRHHADQIAEQVNALVTMLSSHQGMCEDGDRAFRSMVATSVVAALSSQDVPAATVEAPQGVQ